MSENEDQTIKTSQDSLQSLAGLPARYEIRGLIGRGGMGMVFRAHDLNLNRDLAIKVLLYTGSTETESQERFIREAKVLAGLDHTNIVKVLSWGISQTGNFYTVMEYLEGNPLSAEIGGGKSLSPTRFRDVFAGVLSGLVYAHENKLVHRDLKPSNIFLCPSSEGVCAKIIDFGIARKQAIEESNSTPALTKTNTLIGSPAYMSPEQCRGSRVDHRADIYSLACVMYEALTGCPPHEGDSAMELMYKHMTQEVPCLEKSCKDPALKKLSRLIDTCLAKDPDMRVQSAEEMKNKLDEIFQTSIDTGSFFAGVQSKNKRRNLMLVFSAVAVGVLAFFLIQFVFLSSLSKKNAEGVLKQDSGQIEEELQKLRRQVISLERSYQDAGSDDAKTEAAERLVNRLVEQAKGELALQKFEEAKRSLNKALGLCSDCDRQSQNSRMKVSLMTGICQMKMGNLVEAERQFDNGMNCLRVDDWTTKADLAENRALLLVKKREFAKVLGDLDRLTTDFPASAPRKLSRICKALEEQELKSDNEKLTVLKLYDHCLFFMLNHDSPSLLENVAAPMRKLLAGMNGETLKACKPLARDAYDRLISYEMSRQNEAELERLRMLRESFN